MLIEIRIFFTFLDPLECPDDDDGGNRRTGVFGLAVDFLSFFLAAEDFFSQMLFFLLRSGVGVSSMRMR